MAHRVLVILEAGSAYPSGVIRGLVYQESFRAAGIEAVYRSRQCPSLAAWLASPSPWVAPLLSRLVVALLYRLSTFLAWLKEPFLIATAKGFDVVYLSKVTSHRLIRGLKEKTRARVVMDIGDALWLPAARTPHLDEVLRMADAVTTDNEGTASYIVKQNPRCTVIPDCPQVDQYDARRGAVPRATGKVVIGWVGSPSTLYNLFVVWEALERLFAKHDHLHLRLVGTGREVRFLPPFERVRFSCVPRYDQAQLIDEVLAMDIGLFPLQAVQASEVRGVLKAAVYMSGEVPVIASPVGQVADVIREGENGLLARTSAEWEQHLESLIRDAGLRERLGKAGLQTVRKQFTVPQSFQKLSSVLLGGLS